MSEAGNPLRPRTAALEWIRRSAAGDLSGMGWVSLDLDPAATPFSVIPDEGEGERFRHVPYGAFLPPPMVEAAQEAREEGLATALEALLLLFARPEWLIHTRDRMWTPLSPTPELLARLAESYGVSAELHRGDPDKLARLAARLPSWHPHRGRPEAARALLEDALEEPSEGVGTIEDGELASEAFTCRSADWWRRRTGGDPPQHRIVDNVLRFQPDTGRPFEVIQEDIPVRWTPGTPFPRAILRLLPAWQSVRLIVVESEQ